MTHNLVSLNQAQRRQFGKEAGVAQHALSSQHHLFTNEALGTLLDRYPRDLLFALTMGHDPEKPSENRAARLDGLSGSDMLRAVSHGRLWLNITHVDKVDKRYAVLLGELYASLAEQVPGFRPTLGKATLLLSSPDALVYYHVDGPPSVLWHVRGKKRVWVYPSLDERFVSREHLEDIFAGAAHEYVPYVRALDERAVVLDLSPGDVAYWPQNAPHRVTNTEGINVSLSTEHYTDESRARARIYNANRFLREAVRIRATSTQPTGPFAFLKTAAHKAARLTGWDQTQTKRHAPTIRVDPDAPLGWVDIVPAPVAPTQTRA